MFEFEKNAKVISKTEKIFDKPINIGPVLLKEEYDTINMKNTKTFRFVKHVYKEKKDGKFISEEYSHSVITEETYASRLFKSEIKKSEKENLIGQIKNEISRLDLNEFKTKEEIMKFACDNGLTNGEKRKRSTLLQKKIQETHHEEDSFARIRITTEDISRY